MSRWTVGVAVLVVAAACAQPHHAASPLAPTHTTQPHVATFAPTTAKRTAEVSSAGAGSDVTIGGGTGATGFVHALRARAPSLHRCFTQALKSDPGLRRVSVPLRVTIGATGAIATARADGATARMRACVTAVVKRIPLPPGAPMDVEVPLEFHATY